jgi:hypothetical protein
VKKAGMTLGIIYIFAGYTIASYGVILLKGWDITWKQWINPLNPWKWSGKPPPILPTEIWPSASLASNAGGLQNPIITQP